MTIGHSNKKTYFMKNNATRTMRMLIIYNVLYVIACNDHIKTEL